MKRLVEFLNSDDVRDVEARICNLAIWMGVSVVITLILMLGYICADKVYTALFGSSPEITEPAEER